MPLLVERVRLYFAFVTVGVLRRMLTHPWQIGGLNEFPKHTGYRGLAMSWHSVNQLIITIKDAVMITGRGGGGDVL